MGLSKAARTDSSAAIKSPAAAHMTEMITFSKSAGDIITAAIAVYGSTY